ncbi:hypothetical protein Tco_1009739, partial [Tanacetum coccineum]
IHAWKILKDAPKWKNVELPQFLEEKQQKFKEYKSSRSSLCNTTQLGEGSFNLDQMDGDKKEKGGHIRPMGMDKIKKNWSISSIPSSSSTDGSDEALARLLVTEYASQTESFIIMKK